MTYQEVVTIFVYLEDGSAQASTESHTIQPASASFHEGTSRLGSFGPGEVAQAS